MHRILTFSLLLTTLSTAVFGQTKNFLDQPYIEVSGSGDTLITPNEIFIKIVIAEKDSEDRIPVEDQEEKMINMLVGMGIPVEEDLTTSDMLSNYKFYFLKKKDIVKSKEYQLKVRDAETASKVFVELENLDISNTSINRVNHTELEAIKNKCRIKAVKNAKDKAIALTKPLSQSPGAAIFISDVERDLDSQLTGRSAGAILVRQGEVKQKNAPPKIEFEKIKVSLEVQVKFILK